jgi:hypothetical protein
MLNDPYLATKQNVKNQSIDHVEVGLILKEINVEKG